MGPLRIVNEARLNEASWPLSRYTPPTNTIRMITPSAALAVMRMRVTYSGVSNACFATLYSVLAVALAAFQLISRATCT